MAARQNQAAGRGPSRFADGSPGLYLPSDVLAGRDRDAIGGFAPGALVARAAGKKQHSTVLRHGAKASRAEGGWIQRKSPQLRRLGPVGAPGPGTPVRRGAGASDEVPRQRWANEHEHRSDAQQY